MAPGRSAREVIEVEKHKRHLILSTRIFSVFLTRIFFIPATNAAFGLGKSGVSYWIEQSKEE